jgi:two-component system response regulator RegA
MLMPNGAQLALAPAALPSAPVRREVAPVRAPVSGPAPAPSARESVARQLLFVGCEPDPGWIGALARRGVHVETISPEEAAGRLGDGLDTCLVLDADAAESHAALRAEIERVAASGTVALLASAPALFSAMADWKACGVAHVLLKPVDLDELLAITEPSGAPPAPRLPSLERLQREYIRAVLDSCSGNVSEAARQLGMYRQSLQRMLRRHPAAR